MCGGLQLRRCRVCGCSNDDACVIGDEPCSWVGLDLCSACVDPIKVEHYIVEMPVSGG